MESLELPKFGDKTLCLMAMLHEVAIMGLCFVPFKLVFSSLHNTDFILFFKNTLIYLFFNLFYIPGTIFPPSSVSNSSPIFPPANLLLFPFLFGNGKSSMHMNKLL